MNSEQELPTLPAEALSDEPRKRGSQIAFKPESAWATRIRKLLIAQQSGVQYMPYLPVPKKQRWSGPFEARCKGVL